jgi:peptidoglycan/LPS O-acetylase OafA/YrhL
MKIGTAPTRPSFVRLDLQVLRAVAVGAVLIYHLWPTRLPGGFVGVDVFFVISGFLITSHLLRSAVSAGGISLVKFWGNRARRLLPLACFVLLATIAAVFAFAPDSLWKPALRNAIAAALYAQNWLLASDSVNYLARDQAPLPTQHYWSLSVEEQFYIVWPMLLIAAAFVAVRIGARSGADRATRIRRGAFIALALVFVASLVYSLWLTNTTPGLAYFATTARAWEFAAGGLLAFIHRPVPASSLARFSAPARIAASWLGLVVIVSTALVLTAQTPFPGLAALVPVAGAALFVWAGDTDTRWEPSVLARLRPVTYLGDISYGIYLWHWPLVVLVPYLIGTAPTTVSKVAVIVASVALAAASKVLIEDPFRYRRFWTANVRRSFYPALAGTLAVCLVGVGGIFAIQSDTSGSLAAQRDTPFDLVHGTRPGSPLVPTTANRGDDHSQMFDCFDFNATGPRICDYGKLDSKISIAVTGDSHAAALLPALIDASVEHGWHLRTFVGMNCDAGLSAVCGGGDTTFHDITSGDFTLVIASAFRGSASQYSGVQEYWKRLRDAGVNVLPVADVPYNPAAAFACIDESGGDAGKASRCTVPRAEALAKVPDRVGPIAKDLGLPYLDLTDVFCDASRCFTVIDNVIVYQDSPSSHLTTTFSRLLAPKIGALISAELHRK